MLEKGSQQTINLTYRSSDDCSEESFDSYSFSSEENYEDESEINMELPPNVRNSIDADYDESVQTTHDENDLSYRERTTVREETDIENEAADMDVEY